MNYGNGNAVLKKFLSGIDWRSKKIGFALYQTVIEYLIQGGYKQVLLDTPQLQNHLIVFYERSGFIKIVRSHSLFITNIQTEIHIYIY